MMSVERPIKYKFQQPTQYVRWLLGAVLVQFFIYTCFEVYTGALFSAHLSSVRSPIISHYLVLLITFIQHNKDLSVWLLIFISLVLSMNLFIFLNRWSLYVTGLLFLVVWFFTLSKPGVWLFQYLMPFIAAFILASYARLEHSSRYSLVWSVLITFILSVIFFWLFVISHNGGIMQGTVARVSGVLILVLFMISIFAQHHRKLSYSREMSHPAMNALIYAFGFMLVFQVIEDGFLHWYTTRGYEHLIAVYAEYTKAPIYTKFILQHIEAWSSYLHIIQAVFESCFAVGLMLRVLVIPCLWGGGIICTILAWVESGIPATWPPQPGSPESWVWTLWFTAFCMLIAAVFKTASWWHHRSWRGFFLEYQTESLEKNQRNHIIIANFILLCIAVALKLFSMHKGIVGILEYTIMAVAFLNIVRELLERFRSQQLIDNSVS